MSLVQWKGPTNQLVEAPDSPNYSLGIDAISCTRTYFGIYAMAVAGILGRGTVGTGAMSGWIVQRCAINRLRGGIGKLTIEYAAGGSNGAASGQMQLPDEMSIEPFEINPDLRKHKRYLTGGAYPLTDTDYKAIELALSQRTTPPVQAADKVVLTAGQYDFFKKEIRGQTMFIMNGFNYSWTQSYFYMTGTVNTRCYLEAPAGPLASFFPTSISSLRHADSLIWTGAMFKYTRRWSVFNTDETLAVFDPDIYA